MPLIALSDLISSQTGDQVAQTLVNILVAVGIPADQWRKGGSISSLMRAMAANASTYTGLRALNVASNFLDFATGVWLQARAKYDFNVDAIGATFASGDMNFVNGGAGIYGPFAPGQVTVKKPGAVASQDVYYQNTATFSLNPGDNILTNFSAKTIGAFGTAGPGEVNTLVSPSMVGVTYSNPEAFIGTDQEKDSDLVTRTKESLAMLSPNGPGDALNFIAKTPALPDGTPLSQTSVPITRVNVVTDKTTGYVYVYLATAAGVPSAPDIAIVQAAIDQYGTPNCRTVIVAAANPVVVPITYKVWIKNTALTVPQAEQAITDQFIDFFSTIPIGGVVIPPATNGQLFLDTLKGQIFESTTGVVKVEIDAPTTDGSYTPDQLPQLGVLTPSVTLL